MSYMDRLRSGNASSFGSGMFRGFGNEDSTGDMAPSPDAGVSSDKPTPNSTTSSERPSNSNSNTGNLTAPGSSRSGRNSYDASPASSTTINKSQSPQSQAQGQAQGQAQSAAVRNMDAFLQGFPGNEFPTGLTPNQQFTMPETPGKATGGDGVEENAGDFNWEQFTAGPTGMTPMSEGVLRTMLQMGPMETMDMGWDNPP